MVSKVVILKRNSFLNVTFIKSISWTRYGETVTSNFKISYSYGILTTLFFCFNSVIIILFNFIDKLELESRYLTIETKADSQEQLNSQTQKADISTFSFADEEGFEIVQPMG